MTLKLCSEYGAMILVILEAPAVGFKYGLLSLTAASAS